MSELEDIFREFGLDPERFLHKPPYIVIEVETGIMRYFHTAQEVGAFLWGEDIEKHAVYKRMPSQTDVGALIKELK